MCVFMIKFQLFNSQDITYFFRILSCLNMLLVCALYLLLYITLTAFFLQCFNYCTVKAPTVYPIM